MLLQQVQTKNNHSNSNYTSPNTQLETAIIEKTQETFIQSQDATQLSDTKTNKKNSADNNNTNSQEAKASIVNNQAQPSIQNNKINNSTNIGNIPVNSININEDIERQPPLVASKNTDNLLGSIIASNTQVNIISDNSQELQRSNDESLQASQLSKTENPILRNTQLEEINAAALRDYTISKLPIISLTTEIVDPLFPPTKPTKFKKPITPYRWAVGISTARYIVNPLIDFDDAQDNDITTKYELINFSLSLQTGKRSNLSAGISFLNAAVNVRDQYTDTYSSNKPSESIASNVAESSKVGALTIEDNESAIMIDFLPDVSLSNGDLLTVTYAIPLKVKALSIPIFYKQQFLFKNFTPYVMGGISLDIYEVRIDDLYLDIKYMGQTIHEPVRFEPVSESQTVGSLYLGMGTQYNLSERWYIEAGVKADLFDTKFTTIEAGVNYRF